MSTPLRRPRADAAAASPAAPHNAAAAGPAAVTATTGTATSGDARDAAVRRALLAVLDEVAAADTKAMFLQPVSAAEVPEYHRVISNPIDLSAIRALAMQGGGGDGAAKPIDTYNRLQLMFSNALVFNRGRHNPFRRHAKRVRRAMEAAWAKRTGAAGGGGGAAGLLDLPQDEIEFYPEDAADDDDDDDADFSVPGGGGDAGGGGEDVAQTVAALAAEAEMPIEALRAQYAAFMAKRQSGAAQSDEDDSDADDEEAEECDDDEEEDDDDDNFEDSTSDESADE